MILTEYNSELHIKTEKQYSYEEGKAAAMAEAKKQVEQIQKQMELTKKVCKLHMQGKPQKKLLIFVG